MTLTTEQSPTYLYVQRQRLGIERIRCSSGTTTMTMSRNLLVLPVGAILFFFLWISSQEVAPSEDKDSPLRGISTVVSKKNSRVPQNAHDDAPLFVLQIGPSKTGTSTLQYYAANNADLLEEDNIYYIGHNRKRPEWNLHTMTGFCYSCDGPKAAECDVKWAEFERTINNHYAQNHSVLAIEEMFSAFHSSKCEKQHLWDRLIPLLSKWRVRILFTYRRYYEWVPSQYTQLYNPDGCGKSKRKILHRQSWPDKGGKVIKPFPDFFDSFEEGNARQPPVIIKKWKDHFDNVQVFNMHTDGEFLTNFFCQMVPEAARVCNHLSEEYESLTKNPSSKKHLHFDMLATEAYQRGWVNKSLSRKYVGRAVEAHAKELGLEKVMDFPTYCLSQEQTDELLKRALDHESDVLPELYLSPSGEQEIRKGFAEASEKGMFCSVHVDKVFQDKKWKNFFANLDGAETNLSI